MKWLLAVLVAFFILLQYQLWFASGGIAASWRLNNHVVQQHKKNSLLNKKGQTLRAEISDLKKGNQAVEERARSVLGMVKKGEVYYQVVKKN